MATKYFNIDDYHGEIIAGGTVKERIDKRDRKTYMAQRHIANKLKKYRQTKCLKSCI